MHREGCVVSAISSQRFSESLPNCLIQKIDENCHFLHPFQPTCRVFHGTFSLSIRIVQDFFSEILGVQPSTSHRGPWGDVWCIFLKSQAKMDLSIYRYIQYIVVQNKGFYSMVWTVCNIPCILTYWLKNPSSSGGAAGHDNPWAPAKKVGWCDYQKWTGDDTWS